LVAVDDVDELIEHYHIALGEFMKGNLEPAMKLFSHRDDVSLAKPRSGLAHRWKQVAKTMEHAASSRRDGDATGFEIVAKHVTPEFAYAVEVERLKAKIGDREEITPYALRVTMIPRPEDGIWKVVHRHADQISATQPADPVIQK
jgi:ketosteroid isomerase-like protein